MSRLVSAWKTMEKVTRPVIWLSLAIMLATDFIWDLAWWGKVFSLIFWIECGVWAWVKTGRQAELRRPILYSFAGLLAVVLAIHYYRLAGWFVVLGGVVMNRLTTREAAQENAGQATDQ